MSSTCAAFNGKHGLVLCNHCRLSRRSHPNDEGDMLADSGPKPMSIVETGEKWSMNVEYRRRNIVPFFWLPRQFIASVYI